MTKEDDDVYPQTAMERFLDSLPGDVSTAVIGTRQNDEADELELSHISNAFALYRENLHAAINETLADENQKEKTASFLRDALEQTVNALVGLARYRESHDEKGNLDNHAKQQMESILNLLFEGMEYAEEKLPGIKQQVLDTPFTLPSHKDAPPAVADAVALIRETLTHQGMKEIPETDPALREAPLATLEIGKTY